MTSLTSRERQVLGGIVAGLTAKEIAHTLALSVRTIESHRMTLKTKLRARTIADVVRIALQENLIESSLSSAVAEGAG